MAIPSLICSFFTIGKGGVENFLTFGKENKMADISFLQKLKMISKFSPVFVLTTFFCICTSSIAAGTELQTVISSTQSKSFKYGWFKDKTASKLVEFTPKLLFFLQTAWSSTIFTPIFQYFYTYISAISVTFCNSDSQPCISATL